MRKQFQLPPSWYRHGTIPSSIPGQEWMYCAWSDCAASARFDFQVTVPGDDRKQETYAFCNRIHLKLWMDSPRPVTAQKGF